MAGFFFGGAIFNRAQQNHIFFCKGGFINFRLPSSEYPHLVSLLNTLCLFACWKQIALQYNYRAVLQREYEWIRLRE